jgi:hypothetical protein
MNDDIERVGTRKSLRTTKKTLKASDIEKERVENTCDSDDDVITVEPSTPPAPRPNRVRGKSITTTTTATATSNITNSKASTREQEQILTDILYLVEVNARVGWVSLT